MAFNGASQQARKKRAALRILVSVLGIVAIIALLYLISHVRLPTLSKR